MLDHCAYVQVRDRLQPLDESMRSAILDTAERLSRDALHPVAVAYRPLDVATAAMLSDGAGRAAKRADPVAPAQRSDEALSKAARKRTDDDYPVHSFTSLLTDLATLCANHIQPTNDLPAFTKITTPTPGTTQRIVLAARWPRT